MTSDRARHYFLHERHELSREPRDKGGGAQPQLAQIDWNARAASLIESLRDTRRGADASKDPLAKHHYFVVSRPAPFVAKTSTAKTARLEADGFVHEAIDFAGDDARILRRLGLDLLWVAKNGDALVHALPEDLSRLDDAIARMPMESPREKNKLVRIASFALPDRSFRVDQPWLDSFSGKNLAACVIALPALLRREDVDIVSTAVLRLLTRFVERPRFQSAGSGFDGRRWFALPLPRAAVEALVDELICLDSVHPPLMTPVSAVSLAEPTIDPAPTPRVRLVDLDQLPVVGVVDTGIPLSHSVLRPFLTHVVALPGARTTDGRHGSEVATRVVFGDLDADVVTEIVPRCRVLDIQVPNGTVIHDSLVLPSLQRAVESLGVRVFNLSFDTKLSLGQLDEVECRKRLQMVADLDNFAFAYDVIIVVAAGNSPPDVRPKNVYPDHLDEDPWRLGPWASAFNTLTCGAYVDSVQPDGVVTERGYPSPFTRAGPGVADAPTPDFGFPGGNATTGYHFAPEHGVWTTDDVGRWIRAAGTSLAAPLLAQQCALLVEDMKRYCPPGVTPFAATVKAFLKISAHPTMPGDARKNYRALAERTLGTGQPDRQRFSDPGSGGAIIVWQGVLDDDHDLIRILVPIPRAWLARASKPVLRVVVAWESPVDAAKAEKWAVRAVSAQLEHHGVEVRRPARSHPSYPMLDLGIGLDAKALSKANITVVDDSWALRVWYERVADDPPALDIGPAQRVGIAMALFDADDALIDARTELEQLEICRDMVRLGVARFGLRNPAVVETRV